MTSIHGSSSSTTEAVSCSTQPLGIDFHQSRDLLAAGLIDGTVELHDYSSLLSSSAIRDEEDDTILSSTCVTRGDAGSSCRSVLFSPTDPNVVYACGNDGTLSALCVDRVCDGNNNGNGDGNDLFLWRQSSRFGEKNPQQHAHGINTMYHPAPNLLATGDDEGVVKLWDTRLCGGSGSATQACVSTWNVHTDFVSALAGDADGRTLLASSGDCTLSAFDLRTNHTNDDHGARTAFGTSHDQQDELLSLAVLKGGKKVVCGTQTGALAVWSWGKWEDASDRFPGHPSSVDALLQVDEDTVVTGSSDGVLRVVRIQPDRLLGVLTSEHDCHDGFPVEELRFDRERRVIGSVSHDDRVRLWDASVLRESEGGHHDDQEEERDNAMDLMRDSGTGLAVMSAEKISRKVEDHGSDDDWEDMDDDDDDDGSDDESMVDSDDSGDESGGNVGKSNKGKGNIPAPKTDNEKFFEDL